MTSSRDRVMKDSGVDWIGRIPESWQVGKFRHLFTESKEVNGKNPVGEMLSVSGYRGVELKEYSSDSLKRDQEDLETYRVVRPGQLAVNTMWLNYAGLGVSELIGHVSPAYRSYWIDEKINPRFAHHLMRSQIYVNAYTGYLTGVRPNSLQMSRENLMNWPVLLPEMSEQQAIAEYLDRETAQIDELIAKQEQLIETLNERRNTYLIKMFSMPATGTETGWSFIPLKHLVTAVAGGTPESDNEEYWADQGLPWISIGDMSQVKLVTETKRRVTKAGIESKKLFIGQPGTVLFAMYASVGETSILGVEATWNQAILGMVPISGRTSSSFLQRTLEAHKHLWNLYANSNTQFNLNRESTLALKLPIPDMAEQLRIVNAMNEYESAIDPLIKRANKMVELLSERRQALISAAVTGKIDVWGK